MLSELRIRNFAIIESLTLPLAPGFNVLSGETGAGKSIIVGALGVLLGERASADLIRGGSDRATVEGVFELAGDQELLRLLDERGIEIEDGTLILRRELSRSGRSRAWANGSTVTASVLGELGRLVVNLHGQHEAQDLLDGDSQRRILDAFGAASGQADRVRADFEALHSIREEIASLDRRKAEAEARSDYLRHVTREIEDARLSAGEAERLEEEARRLEHAEELRSLTESMSAALEGGDDAGALAAISGLQRPLVALQRIDASLGRLQELYDTAFYALEELARALADYGRTLALDPQRLAEVQRRRDLLFRLMKKHGRNVEEVLETGRRARAELDLVESAAFDLRQLRAREDEAGARLEADASTLTGMRRAAAVRLAAAVEETLPELGMPGARFEVALLPRTTSGPTGAEDVEFRISTNAGHEVRALARVASGGELSRVMLGLKTRLAQQDRVATLVFDEVDSGIGGRVALQVGDTLRRLAAGHQVFAITHLAQIAARAHHHILVSKGAPAGMTTADVRVVTGNERIAEIARMLGGDSDREVSRQHARELLESAIAPTEREVELSPSRKSKQPETKPLPSTPAISAADARRERRPGR